MLSYMEQKEIITCYNSKGLYQKGIPFLFKEMFREVYQNRELIYRLFWRSFVSRYKNSLLSWGWIFFLPIMTMLTFLLLNMSGVLKIGDLKIPYPIYGLLSLSIWNLFSNGLTSATNSVMSLGDIISKINFSKAAMYFSSIGQVIVDFIIRMAMILVCYVLYLRLPNPHFFLFFLYTLPILLLTCGIGFFTSILQVIFKDTINFVTLSLSFLLFLIPIMYQAPNKGLLQRLNVYDPLYYLVSVPRDMMIFGKTDNMIQFIFSSIFALIFFLGGWLVFYLSETKLAERI